MNELEGTDDVIDYRISILKFEMSLVIECQVSFIIES